MRTAPLSSAVITALASTALANAQEARPLSAAASPPAITAPAADVEVRTHTVTLPRGWSMRFDVPSGCPTCGSASTGSIPNGNAPWRAFGGLQWHGESTTLGATLVAERGARLPLYMSAPAGSAHTPTAADSRPSDMRLRWQTVLSAEQRVLTTRSGNTASVFVDAYLPFGARTAVKGSQDTGAVSSSALIRGVRLRF